MSVLAKGQRCRVSKDVQTNRNCEMSSKSSSIPSASPLPLTDYNAKSRSHPTSYFRPALTEQTKHVLPLVPVTHILALRIDQDTGDRMSLFPVLMNPDAPRFLAFLKEPSYDTKREVFRHVCDEHLHRRGFRAEGEVSVGPPWVSEDVWRTTEQKMYMMLM